MSLVKFRSAAIIGTRAFSRCSVKNSTYNILNETEVLNVEDNLENLMEKKNYKDPEVYSKVNIGFSVPTNSRSANKERISHMRNIQKDENLKRLSLKNQLKIPLEEVTKDWEEHSFVHHMHAVANHFHIYDHLFGLAYFYPVLKLNIGYPRDDGKIVPVHRGNIVTPTEASTKPSVEFKSSPESMWTLGLIGMDGHLDNAESQYIHWLVSNIPSNEVHKGDEIFSYLQPFPLRGVGYQRFAFILYKQKSLLKLDVVNEVSLKARTFNNENFYRAHQDNLTPAGLAIFQSVWDSSVTELFHNQLKSVEPIFEYDNDPPHHPKQEWFPLGKPFDLYLDRYRDPKQIAREFLVKKFKSTNPFRPPAPPLQYPSLIPHDKNKPSWLNRRDEWDRNGWGRINEFLDK